jgi:hypothetical protein
VSPRRSERQRATVGVRTARSRARSTAFDRIGADQQNGSVDDGGNASDGSTADQSDNSEKNELL